MTQQHDYREAVQAFRILMSNGVKDEMHEVLHMKELVNTVDHALTTLQAITSALPEGVDPVRLVKGLAGEPSEDAEHVGNVAADSIALPLNGNSYTHDCEIAPAVWNAMRAQLYREASEGAG